MSDDEPQHRLSRPSRLVSSTRWLPPNCYYLAPKCLVPFAYTVQHKSVVKCRGSRVSQSYFLSPRKTPQVEEKPERDRQRRLFLSISEEVVLSQPYYLYLLAFADLPLIRLDFHFYAGDIGECVIGYGTDERTTN